jgi:hypothetical protein
MEREIKNVQVNHFRFYSLPLIIFGTIVYFTSERQYKKYLTEIHKNLELCILGVRVRHDYWWI